MRPGRPAALENGEALELPESLGDRLPDAPGAEAAAALTRAVVAGEAERIVDYTVVLSAGLRLYAAGLADTVLRGMAQARAAVSDGRAHGALTALLRA